MDYTKKHLTNTNKTADNIVLAKCGEKYKVERLVKFIRRCFFVLIFFLISQSEKSIGYGQSKLNFSFYLARTSPILFPLVAMPSQNKEQ